MIRIKAFGNNSYYSLYIMAFVAFTIFSCKPIKNDIVKHNFITGEKDQPDIFYNDSIDVSIDFLGNAGFEDLSEINRKKIEKKLHNIKGISVNNLIVSCQPNEKYSMYYFYEKINNPVDTLLHEKCILTENNRIAIGEKQKGIKKITTVTQAFTDSVNVLEITKSNMTRIYLDSSNVKKLSYLKIFNYYTNVYSNYLQGREKLKTAPIKDSRKKLWKNGFITTLNSFMSNNNEYDSIIKDSEKKKPNFEKTILPVFSQPEIKKDNDVFTAISELASKNQIIMLNEDHYYPKHRLFAMQLLETLKQNGFQYISIEAFTPNTEDNKTLVPNSKNGLYTKEPYFGNFLRKANVLGFTILGHENYDNTIDREIGQAKNILKILEKDPHAKIFVYAGHGHLEKSNTKKRLMASYLKEYSAIDPITINQEKVVLKTKEKLVLIPRSFFANDTLMQSSADYFLINNLDATLANVYPDKNIKTVTLSDSNFDSYKNEELLVSVFDWEEYNKTKSANSLVPLLLWLEKPKGGKIQLNLPQGKYHITVKTVNNKLFKFNDFEVK